ncbi:hypothetical protein, partial [Rhodocaloribacter sp.]
LALLAVKGLALLAVKGLALLAVKGLALLAVKGLALLAVKVSHPHTHTPIPSDVNGLASRFPHTGNVTR